MAIKGDLTGLARHFIEELTDFSTRRWPKDVLITEEIALYLQDLTRKINREIVIYVNRTGFVEAIAIGNRDSAPVDIIKQRRGEKSYSGIKMIHTHPYASAKFSDADISTLEKLYFDVMVVIGDESHNYLSVAFLEPNADTFETHIMENLSPEIVEEISFYDMLMDFEKSVIRRKNIETNSHCERAILVFQPSKDEVENLALEQELHELAKTGGLDVVGVLSQKQRGKKFYFGEGKRKELSLMVQNLSADCVVFDERLSPSEVAKLSFQIGTKVIDKTVLILDIFAQRAKSREGKLQVELAQLEYQLPRLSGQGIALSRQGGGIGTRGPGETQLETDKRHIYRRINFLKKSLKDIEKMREVQSQNRKKKDVFLFSLVGYTNAGKSSLLNLLTNENIYVADQLFATLDSTTRRLPFFQKREVLLSDTVGFIRNLPPELVDAFKSTLMELEQADVILHLVDLAQEGYEKRIEVVDQMIKTLGLAEKKQVYILNKVDLLDEIPPLPSNLLGEDCCYISVASNIGIEELKRKLEGYLENTKKYDLCVPYQMNPQKIISELYSYGKVKNIIYEDYGANLQFESKQDMPKQYLKFIDE